MFFLQGISEMLQQKNVRLDETQVCEAAELRRKLQSELELLMAYQVSLFVRKSIFEEILAVVLDISK